MEVDTKRTLKCRTLSGDDDMNFGFSCHGGKCFSVNTSGVSVVSEHMNSIKYGKNCREG